jgi:predicted Zn-dependent protease
MKRLGRIFVLATLQLCLFAVLQAQEDISRNNELPNRIGGANCSIYGGRANATVQGFLQVNGTVSPDKKPKYSVSVFAGGAFVARQRLKSGQSFIFYCVPNDNVVLVGEVDSMEYSSVPVGQLIDPPAINRQDVVINFSDLSSGTSVRNEVLSARSAYERSKENGKLFEKALDEIQAKNVKSAEKRLNEIVGKDPDDFPAWNLLGGIYFNSSRFDEAEKAFDRSLALKKDYVPAMIGLGRSNLSSKKFDRAIEVLTATYVIEPGNADVNAYLGEAYLQVRKGSLAIVHINKALEIAPDQKAELHLRLAALYNAAGAKNLAAKEYQLFLQKRPNHPDKQKIEKYISENSK